MAKIRKIFLVLTVTSVLFLVLLFLIGFFKPKSAGIYIETSPTSLVSIDGIQVGRTLYDAVREPGEVTVRLEPESQEGNFEPFETKVTLVSNIQTIIKREFGKTDEESSGEILSFEKIAGKEASLVVVSVPDAAEISIDGFPRGFAPYKINSISVGEHQLKILAANYSERTLSLRAYPGYKLTVFVKLSFSKVKPFPTPQAQINENKILVEILDTPNGFLRVRQEPSTESSEIARVKSKEKFPFVEEDSKADWFKIEYQQGKEGWVSKEYSKKIEEVTLPSPSPTPANRV